MAYLKKRMWLVLGIFLLIGAKPNDQANHKPIARNKLRLTGKYFKLVGKNDIRTKVMTRILNSGEKRLHINFSSIYFASDKRGIFHFKRDTSKAGIGMGTEKAKALEGDQASDFELDSFDGQKVRLKKPEFHAAIATI